MRARTAVLALVFAAGSFYSRGASAQLVSPVVSRVSSGWSEVDKTSTFDEYDPHLEEDDPEDRDAAVRATLPGILIALFLGSGSGNGVSTSIPRDSGGGGSTGGGGTTGGGGSNGGGGSTGGNPGGASVPEPGAATLAWVIGSGGAAFFLRLRYRNSAG